MLFFTTLLSSCLKETAIPIKSAFTIEVLEDKTSPVIVLLKMKVTEQMSMNGHLKEDCQVVLPKELRVRLSSLSPVSTK